MKERFSDRIGVTKPSEVLQIDGMSAELRNSIWNYLYETLISKYDWIRKEFLIQLCIRFLRIPIDELPNEKYKQVYWFKNIYGKFNWYEVYNLLEFLYKSIHTISKFTVSTDSYVMTINFILKEENSGFRFIDGTLAPITNQEEIKSLEESIAQSNAKKMYGTAKHFETSIVLFSKRPDPDYRNSIKESINAVESLVKQLTGEKGGGLDKALTLLDSKVNFHGAFKSALSSLYGYTSDESGIRHPILEEKEIGFDEAKYMLVSCSAFVNFIIAKAEKAGLLK